MWTTGNFCDIKKFQDALVPEGAKSVTNVALFTGITFTNNTSANGGSAVHLISSSFINQIVATTNFTDWWVQDIKFHTIIILYNNISWSDISTFFGNKKEQSAIVSFRFPISLSGTNVFRRNEGGGISLMQSRVDLSGTVHFIENSAVVGGGMALEDQCLVMVNTIYTHCRIIIYNLLLHRFIFSDTQRWISLEIQQKCRVEPYPFELLLSPLIQTFFQSSILAVSSSMKLLLNHSP